MQHRERTPGGKVCRACGGGSLRLLSSPAGSSGKRGDLGQLWSSPGHRQGLRRPQREPVRPASAGAACGLIGKPSPRARSPRGPSSGDNETGRAGHSLGPAGGVRGPRLRPGRGPGPRLPNAREFEPPVVSADAQEAPREAAAWGAGSPPNTGPECAETTTGPGSGEESHRQPQ